MSLLSVFLRGLLMGAADIVPGVSGGTMAFITGIYDRLLGSIRAFDLALLRLLLARDFSAAWRHVDAAFLLTLLLGIATSILSLARVLSWLLVAHPLPLWAFFFGLILASALVLLRHVRAWTATRLVGLMLAACLAIMLGLAPELGLGDGLPVVFFAGFLAICAMILPGISGSFILVLLGMYSTVLLALKSFDMVFIAVFAAGAAAGLMLFSRVLYWLLNHFHGATMAVLTGFLLGSLSIVWPWKLAVADARFEGALRLLPVLPAEFSARTGQASQFALCLSLAVLGALLVYLIETRWRDPGPPA